jgi:YesN/AraC family two-component response regulator
MIQVVIAEDQPMVRAGFRSLLDSRTDIEVVGEAATGAQALEQVRAHQPDVAVMDIRMPEMDAASAVGEGEGLNALEAIQISPEDLCSRLYG